MRAATTLDRAVRPRGLWLALLLLGCGGTRASHTATTTTPQPPRAPQAPAPPTAWLPGELIAVLHLELAAAQELLPAQQILTELWGEARAAAALRQVQRVHVGVTMMVGTPQLTLVVEGEPPLPAERTRETRAGRTVELAGDEVWARVGEGRWVGCVHHACTSALIAPAQRAGEQRVPDWALPTEGRALELTVGMPRGAAGEGVRAYIHEQMPGVLEALTRGQLAFTPEGTRGEEVRLSLTADFDLASIADNASILLRALAAAAATNLERLGQREPASRLHRMRIELSGRTMHAELRLPRRAARLLGYTLWIGYQARRDAPEEEEVAAEESRYRPPPAAVRTERVAQARRDRRLGALLDDVIAVAGDDVELQRGPGGSWLRVHTDRARADAIGTGVGERLSARGASLLRVARGHGTRPAAFGVFATKDPLDALAVLGTGGHAAGQVRARLAELRAAHGLSVTLANADYLALQLQRAPADPDAVVAEFMRICPKASRAGQLRQLREQRTLDCFFD